MSRKKKHNAEVRARILDGAGRLFRRHGFDGVGIDALMREAGLTRGAFYAHFKTKAALFEAVVADQHPLLSMLRARKETDAAALWHRMQAIFGLYLSPRHFDAVYQNCSMAALGQDVARGSAPARDAYQAAHAAIRSEMARRQTIGPDAPPVVAALTLAIGALSTAAAADDPASRHAILTAAQEGFRQLTERAGGQE